MAVPEPTYESNWIMIGDGRTAVLKHIRETEDEWEFEIIPTDWMKYKYQIEDSELDQNTLTMKKKFPKEFCIPLDMSPKTTVWLILCNWDGTEKESLTSKFNKQLLEENMSFKRENRIFRALLLRQHFAMEKAVKFPSEARRVLLDEIADTKKAISAKDEQKPQE